VIRTLAGFLALVALWPIAPIVAQRPTPSALVPLPRDPALTVGRLPNGLTYYVRKNARPEKRAELRLVVNAGSVLEDPDQLGLAHFTEHMAFNGTTHFAKQQLVDYIEAIGMRFGADLNASTSFDETIYQLLVPTDSAHLLAKGLQILEDWAHGLTFDSTEIRKERGVVIEEWRLGQGAQTRMLRKQFPILFRGSRYAERLPIGTKESLEQFDPAALVRFYRDWYRPDLMAVIAVGDFDPRAVERMIRERFAGLKNPARERPRPLFKVPPRDSTAVAIATDPEATNTTVGVYYLRPSAPQGSAAAYRRSLVDQVYSAMLSQRLYEQSQKPNPPFIGAGGGPGPLVRTLESFSLGAAVSDTGIPRGFEAVLTEVERADRYGFTAAELQRTKDDILRSYEQSYAEREKSESGSYVEEYIRNFLSHEPVPGIKYEFELVKRLLPEVSLDEVNRAARAWLSLKDRVLLVNAPEKAAAAVPDRAALLALFARVKQTGVAAYADTVSSAPLVAATLEPTRIASERTDSVVGTTEWTLPNGVTVILKPTDFKADEVLITGFSPGGSSLEPDSLYTEATFATQVVSLGGLDGFSAVELQKKLAGKAVGVSPYIGTYQQGIRGQGSPKDLETMFQLIYLNLTAPRADSGAFQAFKANLRAAIANRNANPEVAFRDTLTVTLSQHHPRSRPINPAIVDSLDLGGSIAVYRDRFADPADLTFVIVGAFSLEGIRPLVTRYLGNLPSGGRKETWRDVGVRPPTGVVERTVKKGLEPKSDTEIVFTGPFAYSRSERFVLRSLADVLEIKLREELREELGGTYGVSVSASPTKIPREEYSLAISFGSAPDRVDELLAAVFTEIDSLQRFGAAEKELAKVRETALRSRETDLKDNGFWLGQLAGLRQIGEDAKNIVDLASLLPLLTSERIKAAAIKYLDRRNFVRVTLVPEAKKPTP
jgi:zinc protease